MPNDRADRFTTLLSQVRNQAELTTLVEGLMTPQELDECYLRWVLMTRLLQGVTQREIARELGISLGTIARGSRLLKYGPPEFRELVRRLMESGRPNEEEQP